MAALYGIKTENENINTKHRITLALKNYAL